MRKRSQPKPKGVTCPDLIRKWYREIGSRGGQAGKNTEKRRDANRRSAIARWRQAHALGKTTWKYRAKRRKEPQLPLPKRKKAVVKTTPDGEVQPTIGFK